MVFQDKAGPNPTFPTLSLIDYTLAGHPQQLKSLGLRSRFKVDKSGLCCPRLASYYLFTYLST